MYTRAIRNNVLDQYSMVKGLCSSKSTPPPNLIISTNLMLVSFRISALPIPSRLPQASDAH